MALQGRQLVFLYKQVVFYFQDCFREGASLRHKLHVCVSTITGIHQALLWHHLTQSGVAPESQDQNTGDPGGLLFWLWDSDVPCIHGAFFRMTRFSTRKVKEPAVTFDGVLSMEEVGVPRTSTHWMGLNTTPPRAL